ncbi:MAG: STAS domain-containing protein [Chloroflexota bacterium]
MPLEIQTQSLTKETTVIQPAGRMDVEAAAEVRQVILNLAELGAKSVIVDLQGVDFMDSSGLSALVTGLKALQSHGGVLRICSANAQVKTALRLTMLDRILPVYENVQAAYASLRGEQAGENG